MVEEKLRKQLQDQEINPNPEHFMVMTILKYRSFQRDSNRRANFTSGPTSHAPYAARSSGSAVQYRQSLSSSSSNCIQKFIIGGHGRTSLLKPPHNTAPKLHPTSEIQPSAEHDRLFHRIVLQSKDFPYETFPPPHFPFDSYIVGRNFLFNISFPNNISLFS